MITVIIILIIVIIILIIVIIILIIVIIILIIVIIILIIVIIILIIVIIILIIAIIILIVIIILIIKIIRNHHLPMQDCDEVFRFFELEYAKMLERWEKVTLMLTHCRGTNVNLMGGGGRSVVSQKPFRTDLTSDLRAWPFNVNTIYSIPSLLDR